MGSALSFLGQQPGGVQRGLPNANPILASPQPRPTFACFKPPYAFSDSRSEPTLLTADASLCPPPSSPAPQLLTCLHSVRRAPAEFLLTSGPSHWLFPPSSLSSPHGSVRSQPKGHLPGSWPCPVRPPAPGFVLVLCGNRVSVCTPREPAGPGTGLGVISHHPIPRAPCITRTHRTCDEGRSGEPEAEVHSLVSGILGTGWPSG